ncbi:hypothetical protein R1flu_006899 [Riccia fluitans]|uniref:Dynein light chain n=1 Tax=Riccia fluitans TaxID=41844 RepID=A0ABD1YXB0_9MARC
MGFCYTGFSFNRADYIVGGLTCQLWLTDSLIMISSFIRRRSNLDALCRRKNSSVQRCSSSHATPRRAESLGLWFCLAIKMEKIVEKSGILERKAIIKNADMTEDMQQDAIECATQALDKYNVEKDIAAYIKKEFDKKYNPTWHCIVGRNFGSYVTHETKHFVIVSSAEKGHQDMVPMGPICVV